VPLNRDYVGRTFPDSAPYEVGREKIREFADSIGDANPAYRDPEAAKALGHPDVIAPPTFAMVVSLRAGMGDVFEPGLGLDFGLVVHGEQRFVHHRPIRAGDVLVGNATIAAIRDAGQNEIMTVRLDLRTTAGEDVCSMFNTIVSRGTAGSSG
jgi:acyl dehydratase